MAGNPKPVVAMVLVRDEVDSLRQRTQSLLFELEQRAAPVLDGLRTVIAVEKRVRDGIARHPARYLATAALGAFALGLTLGVWWRRRD